MLLCCSMTTASIEMFEGCAKHKMGPLSLSFPQNVGAIIKDHVIAGHEQHRNEITSTDVTGPGMGLLLCCY